jgi:four helix bundle protein
MSDGPVQSFEDLIAWQKARALTREIYAVTRGERFREDRALVDQMRRAAVSTMANIAEGYERSGTTEYLRYLAIAKASSAELCSHLYVALDAGLIEEQAHARLLASGQEVGRIVGGLIRAIRHASGTRASPDHGSSSALARTSASRQTRTSDLGPRPS